MAKRILIGLGVIGLGVLVLLSNIGSFEFTIQLWSYWPIFIILVGLGNIVDERKISLTSVILLLLGVYFLGNSLELFEISFWEVCFPLILILIGFSLIFGKGTRTISKLVKENKIKSSAVFTDRTEKLNSNAFEGANATVAFGGMTMDFSKVKTKGKSSTIDVNVAFGGMDLKIPDDWVVNSDGLLCVFGGVEDSRKKAESGEHILYITGVVAFGGVEIK